jgi:hypothetical protein
VQGTNVARSWDAVAFVVLRNTTRARECPSFADTLDEIWPEKKLCGACYWLNLDKLRNDIRPVDIFAQK